MKKRRVSKKPLLIHEIEEIGSYSPDSQTKRLIRSYSFQNMINKDDDDITTINPHPRQNFITPMKSPHIFGQQYHNYHSKSKNKNKNKNKNLFSSNRTNNGGRSMFVTPNRKRVAARKINSTGRIDRKTRKFRIYDYDDDSDGNNNINSVNSNKSLTPSARRKIFDIEEEEKDDDDGEKEEEEEDNDFNYVIRDLSNPTGNGSENNPVVIESSGQEDIIEVISIHGSSSESDIRVVTSPIRRNRCSSEIRIREEESFYERENENKVVSLLFSFYVEFSFLSSIGKSRFNNTTLVNAKHKFPLGNKIWEEKYYFHEEQVGIWKYLDLAKFVGSEKNFETFRKYNKSLFSELGIDRGWKLLEKFFPFSYFVLFKKEDEIDQLKDELVKIFSEDSEEILGTKIFKNFEDDESKEENLFFCRFIQFLGYEKLNDSKIVYYGQTKFSVKKKFTVPHGRGMFSEGEVGITDKLVPIFKKIVTIDNDDDEKEGRKRKIIKFYDGEFVEGKKSGKGKQYYFNPYNGELHIYSGNFLKNKIINGYHKVEILLDDLNKKETIYDYCGSFKGKKHDGNGVTFFDNKYIRGVYHNNNLVGDSNEIIKFEKDENYDCLLARLWFLGEIDLCTSEIGYDNYMETMRNGNGQEYVKSSIGERFDYYQNFSVEDGEKIKERVNKKINTGNKSISMCVFFQGYYFKSKLEAKWAFFFSKMKINYIYEPITLQLNSFGNRYTPDFYLPEQKYFIEIKHRKGNKEEYKKLIQFYKVCERKYEDKFRFFLFGGDCSHSYADGENVFDIGCTIKEVKEKILSGEFCWVDCQNEISCSKGLRLESINSFCAKQHGKSTGSIPNARPNSKQLEIAFKESRSAFK